MVDLTIVKQLKYFLGPQMVTEFCKELLHKFTYEIRNGSSMFLADS